MTRPASIASGSRAAQAATTRLAETARGAKKDVTPSAKKATTRTDKPEMRRAAKAASADVFVRAAVPRAGARGAGADTQRVTAKVRAHAAGHVQGKSDVQLATSIVAGVKKRFEASKNGALLSARSLDPLEFFVASSASARICTLVDAETLLEILEDGEIKNQHQTGYSGGGYDPATRLWLEESMAGQRLPAPGKDANRLKQLLPKYGMAEFPDFASNETVQRDWELRHNSELEDAYGEVKIFFKDAIKERTTFLARDSGNRVSMQSASRRGLPLCDMCDLQSFQQKDLLISAESAEKCEYFETQMWGPVTLDDIAFVLIPTTLFYSSIDPSELSAALARKGIPVRHPKSIRKMTQEDMALSRNRLTVFAD